MKVLTLENTGTGAQILYLSEDNATIPTHQITINHVSPENRRWPRNIQLSNEFIFVKRYGCPTVGMRVDEFVDLCTMAEPKLSWPPLFKQNNITQGKQAVIESVFETTNPELSESDNAIVYQWQQSDNGSPIWNNLEDNEVFTGTKTSKLTVLNTPGVATKVLRCVATNAAGSRASLPITSAAPPEPPASRVPKVNVPVAPVLETSQPVPK